MQAPIYDVPTAADVLETGSYPLLPDIIAELRPPPAPKPSERAAALRLMDQRIRTELLQVRMQRSAVTRTVKAKHMAIDLQTTAVRAGAGSAA